MQRVDIHSHAVPELWRRYCTELGWEKPDGMAGIPDWSVEAHLDLMDRAHIAKSILSITSPGTYLAPGDTLLCRKITRETNAELARIAAIHPDRFSFFASLPLPDVEGAIAEIDFALDHLGAKGFVMMTNSNGVYLGEPVLDRVFEKLNERKAIVMIHPTTCRLFPGGGPSQQPTNPTPEEVRSPEAVALSQYPRPMLEFFFDTTRAVSHLILSKTVERNQNITFIVPHCGAALPPVIERFTSYSNRVYGNNSISSDDVRRLFKTRFYFDLAGFPFPDQIHGLLRFSDSSRLLYGTDFPFLPADAVVEAARSNDREVVALFRTEGQRQIYCDNAARLLDLEFDSK